MASIEDVNKFYNSLQTVSKLIGDLGLSVAEAQHRLNTSYVQDLAAFAKIIKELKDSKDITPQDFVELFRSIAPSRYQFTETVVEVRADLQMATSSELGIGAKIGITAGMFAVAVNASYSRRNAMDIRAAALIRCTLNAIPADASLTEKLLTRGGTPPSTSLPDNSSNARYTAIADAIKYLPNLLEASEEKPKPDTPPAGG